MNITLVWPQDVGPDETPPASEIYKVFSLGVPAYADVYHVPPCVINEVDILFDASTPFTASTNPDDLEPYGGEGRPLRTTAIHEFGHALGLLHTGDTYSVMGQDFRHIHMHDGVASAYPGEDAVSAVRDVYGDRPGFHEDLGLAHWRFSGASLPDNDLGAYAIQTRTRLFDAAHDELRDVGGDVPVYEVDDGQELRVELTTENLGKSDHVANIGYYLSTNAQITTGDTLIGSQGVVVLSDQPETIVSPLLALPKTLTERTDYWVGAIIDHDQQLTEVTEANNRTAIRIRTKKFPPNFEATAVHGPTAGTASKNVFVGATIDNVGGAYDGEYTFDVRLSEDASVTYQDRIVRTVTTTGFGGKFMVVRLPPDLEEGTYHWGLTVHHDHGEIDRFNNHVVGDAIDVLAGPPDVEATQVSGPKIATIGETVAIQFELSSLGGPIVGPLDVAVRITKDDDVGPGDWLVKALTVPTVGAYVVVADVPPLAGPGPYSWGLIVDDLPVELTFQNNTKLGHLVVVEEGRDLLAESIEGPDAVVAGQGGVPVELTVESVGLDGVFHYTYELWLASEAGDAFGHLVHSEETTALGPRTVNVSIPNGVEDGEYHWQLRVVPVAGEFVTDNNEITGNPVVVE